MTIEEFFKKKRIDLGALGKAEPALFSEFKTHFEQMGEKSFDHTKKYWFNKLRHQYHLPPEVKTEKPHIANPIAEQTITESLIENTVVATPAAKPGFVPRFKAGSIAKPAKTEETPTPPFAQNTEAEKPATDVPITTPAPKPGFTPRFKAANMPKPVVTGDKNEEIPLVAIKESNAEEKSAEQTDATAPSASKLGFTPKFRAGDMQKPAVVEDQKEAALPVVEGEKSPVRNTASDATLPKPAYKPRFNMKNIPPKGDE